ncbi:MAG TPA: uracil-DNA glycosylase family protein [Burkholderiaceae bacterium]|nr:uracil-DNA glycosylase family protein [Burkholderiaceae bacterium]
MIQDVTADAFCSEGVLAATDVANDICQQIVDCGPTTKQAILDIYAGWKAAFSDEGKGGTIPYVHDFRLNERNTITSQSVEYVCGGQQGGIDFPVWFAAAGPRIQPRRVMIIGQDPLRRPSDYRGDYSFPIGTPYAVHDRRTRERRTSGYWNEIRALLENNCDLYLTDLYKVYRPKPGLARPKDALDFFRIILQIECDLYRPDLIVAFGRQVYASLCHLPTEQSFVTLGVLDDGAKLRRTEFVKGQTGRGIPVAPLLHPSGLARPFRHRFFQCNPHGVVEPTFTTLILHALSALDVPEMV